MINCVTAIDLNGNVLWQVGERPCRNRDDQGLCCQVYDWNGDGKAEVLFTQDFRLKILDGATARSSAISPTPWTKPPRR
jgi:hypothetical protein